MADLFILRPGIWLMRRLRFSAKFALLAGVAVLAQCLLQAQGLGSQVHWWVSGLAVLAVVYLAVALRISRKIQDMRQLSMLNASGGTWRSVRARAAEGCG